MTNTYSNSVEVYDDKGTFKTRIKINTALDELYGVALPQGSIKNFLDTVEKHVLDSAAVRRFPKPSGQGMSNARGAWFEIAVAVAAWNYRIKKDKDQLVIKMPNVSVFDFWNIFDSTSRSMLDQLKSSLQCSAQNVGMITSNPDLLIINQLDLIDQDFNTMVSNLTDQNINRVFGAYKKIQGLCKWDSLSAGVGLKTSLRPDRRLQLVHEGNILKSLFAHLKMRNWDRNAVFKYYGVTSESINRADMQALHTAATHTIVNVDSVPERAVDDLFSTQTFNDIEQMLDSIL